MSHQPTHAFRLLTRALAALVFLAAIPAHAGIVFNYTAEYDTTAVPNFAGPPPATDAAILNGSIGQIGTWSGIIPVSQGGVNGTGGSSFFLANNTATGSGNMLMVDRPNAEPAIMTANLTSLIDLTVGGRVSFTVGTRRTGGNNNKDYDIVGLDATDQESFRLRVGTNNNGGERLGVVETVNGTVFDLVATYGGTGADTATDLDNDGSNANPTAGDLGDITVNLGGTGYTIEFRDAPTDNLVYTTGEIPYNGAATTVTKIDFDFSGSTATGQNSGVHLDDIVVEAFEGIISEQNDTTRILGAQQLVIDWTIPAATATTTYEIVSSNTAVFDPLSDIVAQSGDGTTMGQATINTVGTAGGDLTVTVNAIDGGSTIASVNISFETPIPVLSVDTTTVVLGEPVTFSWTDAFYDTTLDTLILSNDANADTVDLLPLTDPDTGSGSVSLIAVDATYTLTGTRPGASDETSSVTVNVQDTPELAAAVIPSITDGTIPVDICWEATSLETSLNGTLTSLVGTTATDTKVDFSTLLSGGEADLNIVLSSAILPPDPIAVTGVGTNDLTLASAPLDNFTVASTGVIRDYEAFNDAAQAASGLDNTRWAAANTPTRTGNNGAAYFRDATGALLIAPDGRDPVAVSDTAVPGITKAYESGPDIGYASVWEGGLINNEANSDHAMEIWFKPNTLVGGNQFLLEYGGNGDGSYIALVDQDLDGIANEIVVQVDGATTVTIPDPIDPPVTLDYIIGDIATTGTFTTELDTTLLDTSADFDTVLTNPDAVYLVTLTSGPATGAQAEVESGADTVLVLRDPGFVGSGFIAGDALSQTYEIREASIPWAQVLARFLVTNNSTADDSVILYVNGQEVASVSGVNINDASGTDDGGFGGLTGTAAQGGPIADPASQATTLFDGQIAIVRAYDTALSEGIVAANYLAITGGTPDPTQLAAMEAEVADAGYSLSWTLQPSSIVINDGTSDIATITPPDDTGSGCFTTPGTVTTDTTYTVTASFAGGGTAVRSASVTTTGTGNSYEEIIRADGPVAYYRFEEEADSPNIFDYSGNGFNSTSYFGAPGLGTSGVIGNSVVLDGASSINLPLILNTFDPDGDGPASDIDGDMDADGVEAFSLEGLVWATTADLLGNQPILQQLDLNGTGRALLSLQGQGAPRSFVGGGLTAADDPVFDASWCHIAMTAAWDPIVGSYALEFFVDGQLAHPETDDFGDPFFQVFPETSEGTWRIAGDKGNAAFWLGSLDEVAVYNYDLDDPNGDGDTSDSKLASHVAAFTGNTTIAFLGTGATDSQGSNDGIIGPGGEARIKVKVGSTASSVTVNGVAVTPVDGIVDAALTGLVEGDNLITVNVDGEERTTTVTVLPEIDITDYTIDPIGTALLTASNAVPGADYDLEFSPDELLNPGVPALDPLNWLVKNTGTAPASTILQLNDLAGPGGLPEGFYRFNEVEPTPPPPAE